MASLIIPYPVRSIPAQPKTAAYAFARSDDGVPIQFNTASGNIPASLPDPATVAGCAFMANKMDASANIVMITGAGGFSYTLSDLGASVIIMAANGGYIVMSDFTP